MSKNIRTPQISDIEPILDLVAKQNNNKIDLNYAYEVLKKDYSHIKIGKDKFKKMSESIIQRKGYVNYDPNQKPKSQPLVPRAPSMEFQKAQIPGPENDPVEPRFTFDMVGGLEAQKKEISDLILTPIQMKNYYRTIGIKPERGLLLHGPTGCGKTLLAEAAAGSFKEFGLKFFKIPATDLISSGKAFTGQAESKLKALFKAVQNSAPVILLIDNLEAVAKKKGNGSAKIVVQLAYLLEEVYNDLENDIFVIATTSHIDEIDPILRRGGRFGKEISIGLPDKEQRIFVLESLAKQVKFADEIDFNVVASEVDGYVPADIISLVNEAGLLAIKRSINENVDYEMSCITMDDLMNSLPKIQPTLRREGFVTLPPITFNEIGGLEKVKEELKSSIIDAINQPEVLAQYGMRPSSGVILYGPPGCGKTLLARALAQEANRAAFISVKGPELLNKYLGESESAIRGVFQRARDSAPCIIFFDEFDAICPTRSGDSNNQAASRVVNQLLTEMDGAQSRGRVFVIGATNRLELIDEAMLRAGRLDKKLEIPLPDLNARIDILQKIIKRIPNHDEINVETLTQIAEKCVGFSGADLEALSTEATQKAIQESKKIGNWIPVNQNHFLEAAEVLINSHKNVKKVTRK